MPERHPFTESDDAFLAQYIATYNPEPSGRHGNKLYETLVENPKRWPWAKAHPWRSWRERYVKNTEWFDRRIARCLKKQNAAKKTIAGPSKTVSNDAEAGPSTIQRKGPQDTEKEITRRRTTEPAKQQTSSTTAHGGKPNGGNPTLSKDTGNASTDSGYASTTKKPSDEAEKKKADSHPSTQPDYDAQTTTERHGRSGDNARAPPSSRHQSGAKPPYPVHTSDNDSQTNESTTEESEPEGRIGDDDYMHELFGSSLDEQEEPEDTPASSVTNSPRTEGLYPDLQNLPPPNMSQAELHIPGSFDVAPSPRKSNTTQVSDSSPRLSSVHRREGAPQVERRMLKRKAPEEDPFTDGTPPSSPTPGRRLATRKVLPILNEGPFGNRYVQIQKSTENEDATVWPPNRKHRGNDGPSKSLKAPVSKEAVVNHQLNAVASSSKVKLPASTALRPDDPLLVRTATQMMAGKVHISTVGRSIFTTSKQQAIATSLRPEKTIESKTVGAEQPPSKKQKVAHSLVTHQEPAQSTVAAVLAPRPVARISGDFQDNPQADNERPTTRRIDLRASLRNKYLRSGRSSLLSSRSSPASISKSTSNLGSRRDSGVSTASKRRRRSVADEQDIEIMSLFERDLARLGEQYGFALGVVKQTYLQFESLEKTVLVLRTLNEYMKSAQDRVYEDMERLFNGKDQAQDSDDGDIPEGVIPKAASNIGKGKERDNGDGEINTTPSNKRHRQSLNYIPLTTDVEDQSEYSPPSRTRAKRYAKLQKEGREEEALAAALRTTPAQGRGGFAIQESTKISGKEVQRSPTTVRRDTGPSSPLAPDSERSPTPDDDGLVEMRPAKEEEEEEDENVIMILSSETEQRFEIDDEEPRLKAEYKKLSSEATLKNHDALRAFEETQDGDRWRERSWELVKERLDVLGSAQEARKQIEATKKAEVDESVADESMVY